MSRRCGAQMWCLFQWGPVAYDARIAAMTQVARPPGAPAFWRLGEGAPPSGAHVALVPGASVPMLPLVLPEKLRGIARQRVAERQLVEQLSTPAGGFEMQPYTPKGAKQFSRALVADAAQADGWRKGLRAGCQALIPDYLALPAAAGLWVIEVAGDMVRARLGAEDGFSAEVDLALALLADVAPPKAVLPLGDGNEALESWLGGLGVPILEDANALKKKGFSPLKWVDSIAGIDLKEPPSAVYDRLRTKIMRWRVAVVCGALALAVWLGMVVQQTREFQADAARDQAVMTALVREHFVPTGPILDVRAQVASVLARVALPVDVAGDALPPLTQFQLAAPVLTADNLRLMAAAYRGDTGLVTTVEAADFASLDRLIADLQAAEFTVQQLDSRAQQSGGVVARLRLELAQ